MTNTAKASSRLKSCAVGICLMALATDASAARVGVHDGSYRIDGTLSAGDYAKFYRTVVRYPAGAVTLNSDGGDLGEAINIGDLVSKLKLMTSVNPGDLCASACFFIWLNGNSRTAAAIRPITATPVKVNVGLHRPFLQNPTGEEKSLERQREGQKKAASYLEERMIPRRLIDVMMSRPSYDIYWLTRSDTNELGEYSSDVEELLVDQCYYDRRVFDNEYPANLRQSGRVVEADRLQAKMNAIDACSIEILGEMRSRLRNGMLNSVRSK